MKLALIRRHYSATGGAELYLQRLQAALAQAGHEVHLYTEGWDQPPEGVQVHPITIRGSRAFRPTRFAAAAAAALSRTSFDCIFSLERTYGQDVYRAGDGVHRTWLQRRREYAPWWRRPLVGISAFHRNMLRLECRTFDPRSTGRLIVNSEMVKREVMESFGFPEQRIHLVRNGIDVKRFQSGDRISARQRFGVKADDYLLLFVGSGWERKGLGYLLRAMTSLTNGSPLPSSLTPNEAERVKLMVVGKGRIPRRLPSNVRFMPPMVDVEQAYAAADLFVLLPIYEPSANVCLEALAAGLPVITTAQNGAAEVLRPGLNGTVLDAPNHLGAFLEALAFWYSRRQRERPACAASARALDSALSLERNVAETLAVLELAAAGRRTGRPA